MAIQEMDVLDKEIINILQAGIPLVSQPFATMGEQLGLPESEVMRRVQGLKDSVVRQLSAIFDTRTLGYSSSLVAAKILPEHLNVAAKVFNQHPGVTHNYKRNHPYNLWFTIAVPPGSRFGLERTVDLLGEMAQVETIRLMPTLKLFKIGVQLDMTGKEERTSRSKPTYSEEDRVQAVKVVTERDQAVIRVLQQDLPVVSRPFTAWADSLGMTEEELLQYAKDFIKKGQMRRFAAVLYHRKAGFRANGMGVWAVPPERVEEVGQIMASFKAVSHCYLRPTYSDWPYSIFTMVHGQDEADCEAVLQEIEKETAITERDVLYSTVEYKKTRLQYFTSEMEEWERSFAQQLEK